MRITAEIVFTFRNEWCYTWDLVIVCVDVGLSMVIVITPFGLQTPSVAYGPWGRSEKAVHLAFLMFVLAPLGFTHDSKAHEILITLVLWSSSSADIPDPPKLPCVVICWQLFDMHYFWATNKFEDSHSDFRGKGHQAEFWLLLLTWKGFSRGRSTSQWLLTMR